MKVLICGSRRYTPLSDVVEYVMNVLHRDDTVISGMARGVDMTAAKAAKNRGLRVIEMPADWTTGRGAGFARNLNMLDIAERVVAFWDGESPGTAHTIREAQKRGLPLVIKRGYAALGKEEQV